MLYKAKEYNPALRLLALPLVAMAWAGTIRPVKSAYLPPHAIAFGNCKLVCAVTQANEPMFADFANAADELASDILLIRAGLFPEQDNPVTVDIALRTPAELLVRRDHHWVERENADLWVCADNSDGPAMQLTNRGLELHFRRPFSEEERADGACRAAAQIVRLARGMV